MKNKQRIVSIIILLTLLIGSVVIYTQYPNIKNSINSVDIINDIAYHVSEMTSRYHRSIDYMLKPDSDPLQYLQLTQTDDLSKNEIKEINDEFIDELNDKVSDVQYQTDILYFAKDLDTQKTVSNTDKDLTSLNKDQFYFYYQITFNDQGQYSITSISDDLYTSVIEMNISDTNDSMSFYSSQDNLYKKRYLNPKNISITYAVSKDINPQSSLMQQARGFDDYLRYATPIIFFITFITIIITLILPIRYLNEIKILHFISKIKFLFLSIILSFSIPMIFVGAIYLIPATSEGYINEFYKYFNIQNLHQILTPLINISAWFIYLSLLMITIYMIKYIFHKGLKRYIKENTCIGWCICYGYQLLNKIIHFDMSDNINKTVLKIVIVNFIIISIISVFFVFGIFFSLIYSIIIFFLLRKKFTEIKQDYNTLLTSTKQLSQGNFDTVIDEDIGIFNPLKDEFSHIKDGFEKAVNEEVKSQKMKTELISNVSHDLKTPLTSIITYVDLLKQDQISNEDRQQYLMILERNSLRLKNLIEDLFEVSKANSGDIQLNIVDIDICSLVKQAILEHIDNLQEKGLDIRTQIPDDKIICRLDGSKTYRILENLLINISKYAMSHTRVYIDIIDEPHQVQIIFKNISETEMNFNETEIVERFVQGDKSRNTSGSGLGLAIVKSFTEIQNGEFHIDIDGDLFKSIITFKK